MVWIVSAQRGEDVPVPDAGGGPDAAHDPNRTPLAGLVIGAIGVVYGDIGTSPLYALREALRPVARDGLEAAEVLGVLSLLIWALILIVTVKYVLFLLRADHLHNIKHDQVLHAPSSPCCSTASVWAFPMSRPIRPTSITGRATACSNWARR